MWHKYDSSDKKLMTDIAVHGISVSRLICVIAIGSMLLLTSCGNGDATTILTVEAENIDVKEQNGENAIGHPAANIVVYVCGAVQNPGVVELPEGSRAADALEAVGGLLAEAQSDYVNLAAKLEDAQKLYFPTVEEAEILLQEARENISGLVNINTADKNRLCTLPGIGDARADAIIAYREQEGDFCSKEEIMEVPGIKQNAYDKLQGYITVE